jgi:hypothetical protein
MRKYLLALVVAALSLTGVVGCKSASSGCATCGR